jgi:hypothetical protein
VLDLIRCGFLFEVIVLFVPIGAIESSKADARGTPDSEKGLTPGRVWAIVRRFFDEVREHVADTYDTFALQGLIGLNPLDRSLHRAAFGTRWPDQARNAMPEVSVRPPRNEHAGARQSLFIIRHMHMPICSGIFVMLNAVICTYIQLSTYCPYFFCTDIAITPSTRSHQGDKYR